MLTHRLIPLFMGLVLSCAQSKAQSLEHNEQVRKEFSVPANGRPRVLAVYNINGFIKVEGTQDNKVMFDVDKRLTAKSKEILETGKQEFKLAFEEKGDTIMAYISEPFDSRPNRNRNNNLKIEYDFTLDFTVRVPRTMNLAVSTINRGNVTIKDVAGDLRVRNINGAISLINARGATDAHTINGNVEANYLANPTAKSSYYTLNGDIKISYPPTFAGDLQFKSFQGEFFTDFPEVDILPAQVTKNEDRRGDKTVYKLNKITAIRIGGGKSNGNALRFETFNGNVYIKKQS